MQRKAKLQPLHEWSKKQATKYLSYFVKIMNDFPNAFTGILNSKYALKWLLKITSVSFAQGTVSLKDKLGVAESDRVRPIRILPESKKIAISTHAQQKRNLFIAMKFMLPFAYITYNIVYMVVILFFEFFLCTCLPFTVNIWCIKIRQKQPKPCQNFSDQFLVTLIFHKVV